MTSPLIGITVSRIYKEHRSYNQNPSAYSEAIVHAGGFPILIPVEIPVEGVSDLLDRLDGLLLSGGDDVDYHLYHGEAHPSIEGICTERDLLEIELFRSAISKKINVLGICRGMQLINVALGGTLYTHLPEQIDSPLKHNTPPEKGRSSLAHKIDLDLSSKLGRIVNKNQFAVNSFHHQGIKTPSTDLVVTAHATDGLIEAVESHDESFSIIGVQWHPEDLISVPSQLEIFKSFVDSCHK